MAVSDAIGTQRQFTTQPQDPYNRRLRPLRVPVGDYSGAMGDAAALANSLGILGGAIINETAAREERRKQYADLSKHIINEATPDDLEKLRSIEILNKYHPDYNLSDNPYAVANVERAKGQMLTARVKSEFENDTTIYNTSEEAVKAFEDNLREARDEYAGQSDNLFAFDDGVFATHVNDVIAVADKQRRDKSARMKQEALIAMTSKADGIVQASLTAPVEQTVAAITAFANENRLYNLSPKEVFEVYNGLVGGIAQYSGNGELLDAIRNIEVYGNGEKNYTIGDIVPFVDKFFVAGARTDYINTEQMREFDKQVNSCSSLFELNELFDNYPKDADPVGYEAILRRRGQYEALVNRNVQRAAYTQRQEALSSYSQAASQSNFDEQVDGWLTDKTWTATNEFVGSFKFTKYDSEGNLKTYTPSKEELAPMIEKRIGAIMQDDSLDENSKVRTVCKMLSMPALNFYADTIAQQAKGSLATLSPSTLQKGTDGNYVLPEKLSIMSYLRTHGGSYAELCFKDTDLGELDAMLAMQNQLGFNGGLDAIMAHTDTLNDKSAMAKFRSDAQKVTFDLDAPNLDGDSTHLSDVKSDAAQARAQSMYSYLMACGYNPQAARSAIADSFSKNNYIYRGALMPASLFNNFQPQNCKNGLDWIVEQYQKDNGLGDSDILNVNWDNTNNCLVISTFGSTPKMFDVPTLLNQFEYAEDEQIRKMTEKNLDGNEVRKGAPTIGDWLRGR